MLRARFLALKIQALNQSWASNDGGQTNVSKRGIYDLRLAALRVETPNAGCRYPRLTLYAEAAGG
jgi:hypothetical protein